MRRIAIQLRSPAIISLLLVLPFVGLEVINRRRFDEGFPFPPFALLWLLAITFILTLRPMMRALGAGGAVTARSVSFVLRPLS